MQSSFKIGRFLGVDVGVHWSWVFIFFIVTWIFATGVLEHFYPEWTDGQRWIVGGGVSALFFLSVLAHEMSHAVVSNRLGLPVKSITLFVFGGVANLTKEPETPGDEFKVAIVGPATSLAAGAVFGAGWAVLRPFYDGAAGVAAQLALINVSLALFNMLPGFPLDGGRVFRSIAWARTDSRLKATRLASNVGTWIAYGIIGLGIIYTFTISLFSGLWFLLIGFFLRNASEASYQQLVIETTLAGIPVGNVMRTPVEAVTPDTTIDELVNEHILGRNARCFAVMAGGDFAGIITLTDVRKVPRDQWAAVSVYRAMTPASRLHTVDPSDDLVKALELMSMHDVHQVPVVHGRELLGMIDRGDLMRFIQVRRDLAEGEPQPPRGEPSTALRP